MNVLSFDPSGNHGKEGMGTTGWALGDIRNEKPSEIGEIRAKDFDSPEAYWWAHLMLIEKLGPDEIVMEGYKLYNHKGQQAEKQANSELETPQLIGCIKLKCFLDDIPLAVQWASQVKTRWADKVLKAKEILESGNKFQGKQTSAHKRDAIRHWMHYVRYTRAKGR